MSTGKDIDQIQPIQSIRIEEREGFGFEGQLLAVVVTVVLAEFGKAFLGQLAKAIIDSLATAVKSLRTRSPVEIVYQGSPFPRFKAELIISYRSVKALKKDQDQHPYYLAMAAGCLAARPPRNGEIISLSDILTTDSPERPESILLQLTAS